MKKLYVLYSNILFLFITKQQLLCSVPFTKMSSLILNVADNLNCYFIVA